MLTAGGPLMGHPATSDKFAITATSNGVIAQQAFEYYELPCISCGKCTDTCPAGLQPVQIKNALAMADFDRLAELNADKCITCGLCSFMCPSRIELTDKMAIAKKVVIARSKKK
jgi:electron transport complex protein RnfC